MRDRDRTYGDEQRCPPNGPVADHVAAFIGRRSDSQIVATQPSWPRAQAGGSLCGVPWMAADFQFFHSCGERNGRRPGPGQARGQVADDRQVELLGPPIVGGCPAAVLAGSSE
jgi:hypothetical protein